MEGEGTAATGSFPPRTGTGGRALPRALVERWIAKDPNESPRTQRARIGLVRRLALFLLRPGCPAYVPKARLTAKEPSPFVPYIFRHDEIRRLRPPDLQQSSLRGLRLIHQRGCRFGDSSSGTTVVRGGKWK